MRWQRAATVWLGVALTAAFFWVNTVGFVDTFTGSALGCGHNWPLCNGYVIPTTWGLHTIIEFLHRAMVGIVVLLLVVFSILSLFQYGRWIEVRWFVSMCFFFTIVQSILGALGVLLPNNPPALLAIHLGVSLMALNSAFLATVVVIQIWRREKRNQAVRPLRPELPGNQLRRFVFFTTIYTFIAMYIGAYVASSGDGGVFTGWPFPTESYRLVRSDLFLDILHRGFALGLVMIILRLVMLTWRIRHIAPWLYRASIIAFVLVCMQAISGMLLIVTHLSMTAFLLHVSILSCLFAILCYLCLQVLPELGRMEVRKEKTTSGRRFI